MFSVTLAACLLAQAAPQPQGLQDPRNRAAYQTWSAREARVALAEFRKTFRTRDAGLADKLQAVAALAAGSHRDLVKPLRDLAADDEPTTVRMKAASALGHQPSEQANPALVYLVRSVKVRGNTPVLAATIRSLNKAGYRDKQWRELKGLFEAKYDAEYVAVQKALLELIATHKEKQAIGLLVDNLDEPRPVWVDDPENPPAEYWERRWKAWDAWRSDVVEALRVITGQRFNSAAEADAWIRQNGAKIGIK